MARREVVEVECGRCQKKEVQSKTELPEARDKSGNPIPEFAAVFHGRAVTFEDLCRTCRQTIGNYFRRIIKEDDRSDS